MKNQILLISKKLNKKELKSISGGMYDCMSYVHCPSNSDTCIPAHVDDNGCTMIHPRCGQEICRPLSP